MMNMMTSSARCLLTRASERVPALVMLLPVLFVLYSCAGQQATTQSQDATSIKPKETYIALQPGIETDFNSGVQLLNRQQYAQAAAVFKSVIEREQRLPAPYVNLAIAQRALDENKAAEESLISALKLDIHHPVANNELGLLYRQQGKFQGARTAYENAIREHPDYLPARRNLGVLCDLYLHDFECAYEQFSEHMDRKPDDKTVNIWLADVKQRLGK